jgi:hypothetical protein
MEPGPAPRAYKDLGTPRPYEPVVATVTREGAAGSNQTDSHSRHDRAEVFEVGRLEVVANGHERGTLVRSGHVATCALCSVLSGRALAPGAAIVPDLLRALIGHVVTLSVRRRLAEWD